LNFESFEKLLHLLSSNAPRLAFHLSQPSPSSFSHSQHIASYELQSPVVLCIFFMLTSQLLAGLFD
jgi:hypothetical protein